MDYYTPPRARRDAHLPDDTRPPQALSHPSRPRGCLTQPPLSLLRQTLCPGTRPFPEDSPLPLRVSVIMPTLNEECLLPVTLRHTAALGFDELIVVDGGSRDRTREIVQALQLSTQHSALSTVKLLIAPPGRAQQMNAGAATSRGDVLIFLHADTRLPFDVKQAIGRALEDPACVGGRFDVRFEPDAGWGWVISRMMNVRSRLTGIATGDQAIFVRRAVFERLGGFSEIPIMEDVEFSRRLKRAGRVAALRSPAVTSYRRWRTRGPLRTILLMWGLRWLYWIGISPRRLMRKYAHVR
jgi:rSAM/selenodomain-associated transferase 2